MVELTLSAKCESGKISFSMKLGKVIRLKLRTENYVCVW